MFLSILNTESIDQTTLTSNYLEKMKMKNFMNRTAIIAASTFLAACASPAVIDARKVSDKGMSCEKIVQELDEADRFEKDARKERTVTGTNILAAVFFWPALIVTYSNTEDAINGAKERKAYLLKLSDKQNCTV